MKIAIRKSIAFLAAAILIIAAMPPSPAHAGTLSTSIIGMFPKDVGEFAYADLKTARGLPWFPQLRDELLPPRFKQFEQFLASNGVDPEHQVDEVAWGAVAPTGEHGEQIVGIALGQYDPSSTEDRLKQQKLPMKEVRGFHLYAFGSGSGPDDIFFFFIDSNTAAFGMRSELEKLIDVRFGGSESLMYNNTLFPLINEANGLGTVWAVLNRSYTQLGMQQLLPQASQFPQAQQLLGRIQAMLINVQTSSGVDAHFQAVCATPDDANLLGTMLQAGVMYRRYQEQQANPELAKALDGVQVTPRGERLEVRVPVSNDQMGALIRSHTFVVPTS